MLQKTYVEEICWYYNKLKKINTKNQSVLSLVINNFILISSVMPHLK